MNLPANFAEIAQFPSVLRTLIEAELACGNTVELGYGYPAPPVGAYVKLANKVSTRPRASDDGLTFDERNSSLYSGEFTDERRFYFVLEPANAPEPEPDMNAIRQALEARSNAATARASQSVDASAAPRTRAAAPTADITPRTEPRDANSDTSQHTLISSDSATDSTRMLHFHDKRAPQEVQFALERMLMSLFTVAIEDGTLVLRTTATIVGARYDVELRLESASPLEHHYSLRVATSWARESASNAEFYRKSLGSWFELWTRDLIAESAPDANAGSLEHYRELADATLAAESAFDSVASIQQALLQGMMRGASFRFADKEGSTHIFWRDGHFSRIDEGEFPKNVQFSGETELLVALRQFCDLHITRSSGRNKLSDFDAWKLILRLLRD